MLVCDAIRRRGCGCWWRRPNGFGWNGRPGRSGRRKRGRSRGCGMRGLPEYLQAGYRADVTCASLELPPPCMRGGIARRRWRWPPSAGGTAGRGLLASRAPPPPRFAGPPPRDVAGEDRRLLACGHGPLQGFAFFLAFLAAEAAFDVVVDEAHGLHEGVAGGGADEGEAAFAEVLAEGVRGVGVGRDVRRRPGSSFEGGGSKRQM